MPVDDRSGFSLIELLVVVAILGILTGILVAVLNPAQFFGQGRDGRRMSDLSTIQAALEQYYAQNGSYPQPSGGGVPTVGGAFTDGSIVYLKSVPTDPQSGAVYNYCVDANPASNYVICATMEGTPPSDCSSAAYGCSGNCCLTNPF